MTESLLLSILLICANVQAYVICPYCDPNYMAYPNLEETCRGYDVPMGNPNPGADPTTSLFTTTWPAL
jgi:hypothetical protein